MSQDNPNRFRPRPVPPDERSFGVFRLLHELGSGAMATLFLATDELGRLVAVKRLHRHLAVDPDFLTMFRDEAAIAARINHPNVCRVLGSDSVQGRPFIVMEYVHGESLACLFRELRGVGQQLPLEVAAHVIGQACLGLHAAHSQTDPEGRPLSIVHRDVSPQNLLLSYEGELKVVDFGIASAVERSHRTETGVLKGKLAYMSPEQTRSSRVDRRSDIFSLGAVLYEALCGHACFGAPSAAALIQRVQRVDYVHPRTLRPDLPPALEQVISRALSPRPEDRYFDAAQMYNDLQDYLSSTGTGMTGQGLGELLRRLFARRYAMREELRALAFSAPDVLEEEELTLNEPAPGGFRCEYCGDTHPSEEQLRRHEADCGQRRWWERNFGHLAGQPVAATTAPPSAPASVREERPGGWLSRLRDRLVGRRQDPLIIRLRSIEARLGSVRDHQTSELSWRGMTALWRLVSALEDDGKSKVSRDGRGSGGLLGQLKPRILRCANTLLATALELEANAAFLASSGARDLKAEVDALERRAAAAGGDVRQQIERNLQAKHGLMRERERVARLLEMGILRLESMVDKLELTLGRVLQIVSSPAQGVAEADTQITVFIDSLVLELDRLGRALKEVNDALDG
jgi:serine/threonine protein kinase